MTWGKKFVIENQSTYYLHPSEGPRIAITSIIFNRKNYDLWRTALKAKNKLGFIEETLTKPKSNEEEDQSELDTWLIPCSVSGS